jgi:hypothetical protein
MRTEFPHGVHRSARTRVLPSGCVRNAAVVAAGRTH